MLPFTGNIQVLMRNIGTGMGLKTMKITKNKRNWRARRRTWAERYLGIVARVPYIHMHLLWIWVSNSTNMHYDFLYISFFFSCAIVTICDRNVEHLLLSTRWEKGLHFIFIPYKVHTYRFIWFGSWFRCCVW